MGAGCAGCNGCRNQVADVQPSAQTPHVFSPRLPKPNGPTLLSSTPRVPVEVEKAAPDSPGASAASTPSDVTGPIAASLNTIIEHLWSRISRYTSELIIQEVQPALQANLPAALQSICFDRNKCHLGQKPVEFRRVKIERHSQTSGGGKMQNLVFQARVEWDADCSVILRFAGRGLGIRGLSIAGVMLLELVGLMDQPPFFEGVRAFFVNPPDIDIEFQGAGEGLLNLSLIRSKIVDIVAAGIKDQLVLPNRIGYAIAQDADVFSIKSPPAEGVLRVMVWSAKNLIATDANWFGRPIAGDPYVKVRCSAVEFRSPTQSKTLAPEFNYCVWIPVVEASHQKIDFDLYDEDTFTNDDHLGSASIPVQTMKSWASTNKETVKLRDRHGVAGQNGSVLLSASWHPLTIGRNLNPKSSHGIVFAGVNTASRLIRQGPGTQYWVAVRCSATLSKLSDNQKATGKISETAPVEDLSDCPKSASSIRSRLAVLRRYGMKEDDMATVLQVDPKLLREVLLTRSATEAAGELARLDASGSHDVTWDTGFEFPVEHVPSSRLDFELMSQVPGKPSNLIGSYSCTAAEVARCPNGTNWRTVELSDSNVLLRLKLSVYNLGGFDDEGS